MPEICDILISGQKNKLIIGFPNKPDCVIELDRTNNTSYKLIKQLNGSTFNLESGISPIPWFMVHSQLAEKQGLIVYAYGSYGTSVRKTQQRLFIPWINKGYAVASLCVRGGGDNGDDWWNQSRTAKHRFVGIKDLIDGVHYLQKKYNFTRKNTILYGRSAGGFLVTRGSHFLMNSVGAVYACKPYTDILRKATNRFDIDSILETEEFSFTTTDPAIFKEIFDYSPYENIPNIHTKNNKGPGLLLTGGLNDSQVEAYMPIKYAKKSRQSNWRAICRIQENEGHYTIPEHEKYEATDAAIIEMMLRQ
jgi:protease II